MGEAWQQDPGRRLTEMELSVENQVEPRDCRYRAMTKVLVVDPGYRRTEAKAEQPRTKAGSGWSPTKLKGWRDEKQLKARKSMPQAEQR